MAGAYWLRPGLAGKSVLLTLTLTVTKIVETRKSNMGRKLISPRILLLLTALGLVMPIAVTLILGLAALLKTMDPLGSAVLKWIGLGLSVGWAVDLVALVLAQAINSLGHEDDRQDGES